MRSLIRILTAKKVHPKLDPHDIQFILLAGSRARGIEKKDSDYDIIILSKGPTIDKQELRSILSERLHDVAYNDILVYNIEDFMKTRSYRLTDGLITLKRMKKAVIWRISSRVRELAPKPHDILSRGIRRMKIIKTDPSSFTRDENSGLKLVWERTPGEWERLHAVFSEGVDKIYGPGEAGIVIKRYLNNEISEGEARRELNKLPVNWRANVHAIERSTSNLDKKRKLKRLRGRHY